MKNIFYILLVLALLSCRKNETELSILRQSADMLNQENKYVAYLNNKGMKEIKKSVRDNGNHPREVKVLDLALKLHLLFNNVLAKLDSVGDDNAATFDSLQKSLDRFAAVYNNSLERLNYYTSDKLDSFDFKGRLKLFKELSSDERKNYVESFRLFVLNRYNDALYNLSQQMGSNICGMNFVYLLSIPESKIVDEGNMYKSKIMFTATVSSIRPELIVDGKEIDSFAVASNKIIYSFKTSLKKDSIYGCDSTACPQYWNGKLTLRIDGEDSTFNISQKYFVRKPCR
ncbi:MAG: hypothetical protein K2X86_13120 [Cytophagaceae bacterium]|nr:hypothetical protein [Cytophagaceae bacterium]